MQTRKIYYSLLLDDKLLARSPLKKGGYGLVTI